MTTIEQALREILNHPVAEGWCCKGVGEMKAIAATALGNLSAAPAEPVGMEAITEAIEAHVSMRIRCEESEYAVDDIAASTTRYNALLSLIRNAISHDAKDGRTDWYYNIDGEVYSLAEMLERVDMSGHDKAAAIRMEPGSSISVTNSLRTFDVDRLEPA